MRSNWLKITLIMLICQGCATNKPPAIDSLMAEWRTADGGNVFVVEEKLFSALLENPNRFFAAMSTDSLGFSRFITHLKAGVFTNYGDKSNDSFEKKRIHAIKRLEKREIDEKYSKMSQVVITELKRIRAMQPD